MSRSALDRFEQKQAAVIPPMMMGGMGGFGMHNAAMGVPPPGVMPVGMPVMPVGGNHPVAGAFIPTPPLGALGVGVAAAAQALTGQEQEDMEEKRRTEIPLWGNTTTFNMNPLLADRILENDYFQSLFEMTTYHQIVDEIYTRVDHVEPWSAGTGRLPSTAFCLLTKLLTIRLTTKMMEGMLRHQDSPYIRAIGFLYVRIATEPKQMWGWFEEFVGDEEEFAPTADPTVKMTIGKWCIKILTDCNYYNTMLPRIPTLVERQMKAYLILFEEEQRRANDNMPFVSQLKDGTEVRAIYGDEDNDPAWYTAVVNEVVEPSYEGAKPQVLVTFPEYNNQECLALGKIEIPESITAGRAAAESDTRGAGDSKRRTRSRSRDRGRDDRGRDRDRDRDRGKDRGGGRDRDRGNDRDRDRDRDLDRSGRDRDRDRDRDPKSKGSTTSGQSLLSGVMSKVAERAQGSAAAHGKDYAQRPASYKGSLSLTMDRFTHRKKSRSRSPDRPNYRRGGGDRGRDRDRERSPPPNRERSPPRNGNGRGGGGGGTSKYLKDRYGDASAR